MTPEMERARELREKEKKLTKIVDLVKEESIVYERIVDRLVDTYCGDLDSFVQVLNKVIRDIKSGRLKQYGDLQLELRCLELANSMYNATDGLAELGSRSDMAKALRTEKFDKIYSSLRGSGTIPDKTAEANKQLIDEILVDKIMERAYKIVGQKLKNANRLLEAIKKVLTSRMINREVFRKDAPVYDTIIDQADLEEETLDAEGDDV